MRNATVILCALALAGCMPTKQAPTSEVTPAPAARVFPIDAQSGPTGTITITRDVGFLGGGCYLGVMIDGKIAAHLDRAERVTFDLAATRHVLTATWIKGRGLCGAMSEKSMAARRRSTEIMVGTGAVQHYRLYTSADEYPVIEPAL
ncbi:hypothetical protein G9274_002538 [Stenotrophomonas rhizophila]|nr:hypothetical protein G9274_002538 [Stenotrophomonas rhizophila]